MTGLVSHHLIFFFVTHFAQNWILIAALSNVSLGLLRQDRPEAGPLVRPGDQLRPLGGALLPGRPQDSSHEVHEPDHTGSEWSSARAASVHRCGGDVSFSIFSLLENLSEDHIRRAVNQTSAQQGESRFWFPVKPFALLGSQRTFLLLLQLTTYTTLMQVSEGSLESYVRDCPNPCMPW